MDGNNPGRVPFMDIGGEKSQAVTLLNARPFLVGSLNILDFV